MPLSISRHLLKPETVEDNKRGIAGKTKESIREALRNRGTQTHTPDTDTQFRKMVQEYGVATRTPYCILTSQVKVFRLIMSRRRPLQEGSPLSTEGVEDAIGETQRKKRRLSAETTHSGHAGASPFHANLYMNSLANEGTRSAVNCGCLALRDVVSSGAFGVPEKASLYLMTCIVGARNGCVVRGSCYFAGRERGILGVIGNGWMCSLYGMSPSSL